MEPVAGISAAALIVATKSFVLGEATVPHDARIARSAKPATSALDALEPCFVESVSLGRMMRFYHMTADSAPSEPDPPGMDKVIGI
jgi:hypothetical protein